MGVVPGRKCAGASPARGSSALGGAASRRLGPSPLVCSEASSWLRTFWMFLHGNSSSMSRCSPQLFASYTPPPVCGLCASSLSPNSSRVWLLSLSSVSSGSPRIVAGGRLDCVPRGDGPRCVFILHPLIDTWGVSASWPLWMLPA